MSVEASVQTALAIQKNDQKAWVIEAGRYSLSHSWFSKIIGQKSKIVTLNHTVICLPSTDLFQTLASRIFVLNGTECGSTAVNQYGNCLNVDVLMHGAAVLHHRLIVQLVEDMMSVCSTVHIETSLNYMYFFREIPGEALDLMLQHVGYGRQLTWMCQLTVIVRALHRRRIVICDLALDHLFVREERLRIGPLHQARLISKPNDFSKYGVIDMQAMGRVFFKWMTGSKLSENASEKSIRLDLEKSELGSKLKQSTNGSDILCLIVKLLCSKCIYNVEDFTADFFCAWRRINGENWLNDLEIRDLILN